MILTLFILTAVKKLPDILEFMIVTDENDAEEKSAFDRSESFMTTSLMLADKKDEYEKSVFVNSELLIIEEEKSKWL